MSGECEAGKCDICGQEVVGLARKYYYYDVKCECCNKESDPHFEIVYHCSNCQPKPPKQIKAWLQPIGGL